MGNAGYISHHRNQASFSEDAVRTTNYLDDYIVRGKVFSLTLAPTLTASTEVYFTSEVTGVNGAFLLPLGLTPVSGFTTVKIYEDTEYTGGTTLTAVNRNRTSSNVAKSVIKQGATGTNKGTLLFTLVYGTEAAATPSGAAGGGQGLAANSIILSKDKKYLYEVTNSETAVVGIDAEFAEL